MTPCRHATDRSGIRRTRPGCGDSSFATSLGARVRLTMIAVDPAYQRNGVGSLLTSYALQWFKDNGMALAMVKTGGDPGHASARRTYEQAGFVHLPIVRYFKKL
ncbi:MAG: GNAT family N-acetyltransferase [Pseudonocardiales bacterium]